MGKSAKRSPGSFFHLYNLDNNTPHGGWGGRLKERYHVTCVCVKQFASVTNTRLLLTDDDGGANLSNLQSF